MRIRFFPVRCPQRPLGQFWPQDPAEHDGAEHNGHCQVGIQLRVDEEHSLGVEYLRKLGHDEGGQARGVDHLGQRLLLPAEPELAIRDPYIFEFLGLKSQEVMGESGLEDQLLDKLKEFLLEMGHGFCFEARQKRILIGDTHNFVDLVFYHRILKCHVLVELKVDKFTHEHIGQLNTYVSWYKKNEMTAGDSP